ncbi:ESX secretion-associated protein EspG [Rhodococcus sp. NPDC058521]|uniref:ESX secretion-associated protein EspG n=1 Tax=Rhodococcus sp. NPDC058521 TaxID=3346536 RepID=UPI00365A4062
MTTRWRLSALEFVVAWEHLGFDRLPTPLSFLGTAETAAEFETHKAAAARTLLSKGDDNLHRALTVLAEPLAEAVVCGVDNRASENLVRIRAGVDRTVGAVVTQLPGHTREAGSDVLLSLQRRTEVGEALAQSLPTAPAGKGKGLTVHRSDLGNRGDGSLMRSAGYVSPRAEAIRFFDRPHTMFGEVLVRASPRREGRTEAAGEVLQWIDFADDGRYVIRNADTIAAVSASPYVVAREVQRMLTRVEADLASL